MSEPVYVVVLKSRPEFGHAFQRQETLVEVVGVALEKSQAQSMGEAAVTAATRRLNGRFYSYAAEPHWPGEVFGIVPADRSGRGKERGIKEAGGAE